MTKIQQEILEATKELVVEFTRLNTTLERLIIQDRDIKEEKTKVALDHVASIAAFFDEYKGLKLHMEPVSKIYDMYTKFALTNEYHPVSVSRFTRTLKAKDVEVRVVRYMGEPTRCYIES